MSVSKPPGTERAALAATLVGLEPPEKGKNLDIKPYVRGNVPGGEAAAERALELLAVLRRKAEG